MKLYVFPEDGTTKMLRNQPEDSVNHLSDTADLRPIYKTDILHRKKSTYILEEYRKKRK